MQYICVWLVTAIRDKSKKWSPPFFVFFVCFVLFLHKLQNPGFVFKDPGFRKKFQNPGDSQEIREGWHITFLKSRSTPAVAPPLSEHNNNKVVKPYNVFKVKVTGKKSMAYLSLSQLQYVLLQPMISGVAADQRSLSLLLFLTTNNNKLVKPYNVFRVHSGL